MDVLIQRLNRSIEVLFCHHSRHTINLYLIELIQDDFLKLVIVYFLADGVEVLHHYRAVQAEVKLCLVIAKGEGIVTNFHLGDVSHCAAFRVNCQKSGESH